MNNTRNKTLIAKPSLKVLGQLLTGVVIAASVAQVQASPVVAAGSSYDAVVLSGLAGQQTNMFGLSFDGVASSVTNGGRTVTLNDSEQDLGGGLHRISFVFTSTADMFPTVGSSGFVNIGLVSNPLDLLRQVDLVTSQLRMFDAAGSLIASSNSVDAPVAAWNGFWLNIASAGGITNMGARNIQRVELDLNVAEIPEPTSALLALAALLGVAASTRRKSAQPRV